MATWIQGWGLSSKCIGGVGIPRNGRWRQEWGWSGGSWDLGGLVLKVRLERDEEPTDQPRDKRTNAVGIEQHEREKNAILWKYALKNIKLYLSAYCIERQWFLSFPWLRGSGCLRRLWIYSCEQDTLWMTSKQYFQIWWSGTLSTGFFWGGIWKPSWQPWLEKAFRKLWGHGFWWC